MYMRYRILGRTGLQVSEIGFGAWGIGGLSAGATSYGPTDDEESRRALERAFDLGITFYDTAGAYGNGHSEELLGETFRNARDKVVIASKVGYRSFDTPAQDFSPQDIRETLEGTLRRLKSDYLDLYQLHSPALEVLRRDPEILRTLADLQKEGKIRAYGISLRTPEDGKVAIEEFGFWAIQVNFNLIDQRARENGLLDLAYKKDTGIIIRTPLNFGFLSGKVTQEGFDSRDHRSQRSPEQLKKWSEAPALFAPLNVGKERTLSQLALQFCLAQDGVSTVIPGMMKVVEVEENAASVALPAMEAEEVEAIREIYRTHSFIM